MRKTLSQFVSLLLLWAISMALVPVAGAAPTDGARTPHVMLVALDGARPDWIESAMAAGHMPNLVALAGQGARVADMQPVDPPLTWVTYMAMSTGSYPDRTGLPGGWSSHSLALSNTASDVTVLATATEPIWRTAMRHGLSAATLFWPASRPDARAWRANYTVNIVTCDIPSAEHRVFLREASGWAGIAHEGIARESALVVRRTDGGAAAFFNVLALGRVEGSAETYERVLLDVDKDLSNGAIELAVQEWRGVELSPCLHSGAFMLVTAVAPGSVTIFQAPAAYVDAYPAALLRSVHAEFAFPPAMPDTAPLNSGLLTAAQYYDLAARQDRWMMDVTLYVQGAYRPELLCVAQNVIAAAAKAGARTGALPPTPSLVDQACAQADMQLGRLWAAAPLERNTLLVVSGQGMAAAHSTVELNAALEGAQLLSWKKGQREAEIDYDNTRAWAQACGGSAQITINLQGRNQGGIVVPEELAGIEDAVVALLDTLKTPEGTSIFARILRHEELDVIRLNTPDIGDLFVQAAPGYILSDTVGAGQVLTTGTLSMASGYDAAMPEMQAIYCAAGCGIPAPCTLGTISGIDVAPTIAALLGLPSNLAADGRSIMCLE